MSLHRLASWLRCPHCNDAIADEPPLALRCANGHSFDVNKRGYVNLLAANNRMIGDSPSMLDARAAFLKAGYFDPIKDAVAAAIETSIPPASQARILDAGCGTGYYLHGVVSALESECSALAMDISPGAVARAVRATVPHSDGLVADTWQALPVRDSTAHVVMTVFAPRNLPEFSRVLHAQGSLVVVVPSGAHIQELRQTGRAIGIPDEKAEKLVADASSLFSLAHRQRVEYSVELSPAAASELVAMGPSARHTSHSGDDVERDTHIPTTVSVDVLRFSRNS